MSITKYEAMDSINAAPNMATARNMTAHYILSLARGSRELGEPLTDLERELLEAAQNHLKSTAKSTSKVSKKIARVLAMPPKEMLAYIDKARKGGHEIPEIIAQAEDKILRG